MTCRVCALMCWLLVAATNVAANVSLFVQAGGTGWSDVVILPEGPALVRSNDAAVLVQSPVKLFWATGLPEPVLYLNATFCRGEVRAVGQGHVTGQALEIRQSGVRAFGPSFGQNATTIACVHDRVLAYTQFSPTQYAVSDLETMTTEIRDMPATSQGFRDVLATGEVRRGDDWFRLPNQYGLGRSIHQPVERGGIFAGQNSDGPGILAIMPDRAFTVIPGVAFEPALERFEGGFAVAARTPAGAALAIVTPPYPPHEGPTAPPPPPPPVDPPPPPPPPAQELPACANDEPFNRAGTVASPCAYFFRIIAERPVAQWESILRSQAFFTAWYGRGFGQQNGSGGNPRGRMFLPTAICPNAAPNPNDATEMRLGVKQDDRCWDQLGRMADVVAADGSRWIWDERGAQPYQPFGTGTTPPPPPTDDELEAVLTVLDSHRDVFPPLMADGTTPFSVHGRIANGIEQMKEQRRDAVTTIDILTAAAAEHEKNLLAERAAHAATKDELARAKADPCSLVRVDGARLLGIRLPPGECKPR